MPTGTALLDFGATATDEASVVITGQTSIADASHIEAFFMRDVTADNGADEHDQAAASVQLVAGDIVAGTGFTIHGTALIGFAIGGFTIHWVWV